MSRIRVIAGLVTAALGFGATAWAAPPACTEPSNVIVLAHTRAPVHLVGLGEEPEASNYLTRVHRWDFVFVPRSEGGPAWNAQVTAQPEWTLFIQLCGVQPTLLSDRGAVACALIEVCEGEAGTLGIKPVRLEFR